MINTKARILKRATVRDTRALRLLRITARKIAKMVFERPGW